MNKPLINKRNKLTYEIDEQFNYSPFLATNKGVPNNYSSSMISNVNNEKVEINYPKIRSKNYKQNNDDELSKEKTRETYEDIIQKNNSLLLSQENLNLPFNPFSLNLNYFDSNGGCNGVKCNKQIMNDNNQISNNNDINYPLAQQNHSHYFERKEDRYNFSQNDPERKFTFSQDNINQNENSSYIKSQSMQFPDNNSSDLVYSKNNPNDKQKINNSGINNNSNIENNNLQNLQVTNSIQVSGDGITNPNIDINNKENIINNSKPDNCQGEIQGFEELKVSNPFSNSKNYYSIQEEESSKRANKKTEPINQSSFPLYNHISSLESISFLPLEEQIRVLYKDNQSLISQLKEYQKKYGDLTEDDKQNKFKSFLMKENEELNTLNKKYEGIMETFLTFLNKINLKLNREQIDISELKKKSDSVSHLLLPIQSEILMHIKRSIKRKRKGDGFNISRSTTEELSSVSDTEDYVPDKYFEKLKNLNKNYDGINFNYHSPNRVKNCIACDMGLGISQKPYSPLVCSPNKYKYIQSPPVHVEVN